MLVRADHGHSYQDFRALKRLNEYAQLNAMAAPSVRVRFVVQGSKLE